MWKRIAKNLLAPLSVFGQIPGFRFFKMPFAWLIARITGRFRENLYRMLLERAIPAAKIMLDKLVKLLGIKSAILLSSSGALAALTVWKTTKITSGFEPNLDGGNDTVTHIKIKYFGLIPLQSALPSIYFGYAIKVLYFLQVNHVFYKLLNFLFALITSFGGRSL